ncbi:PD-(D/E)XK nuclease family protein [Streptomyces mashuensis]|uniref:PD-(D/E)XK nuclease family protein n=1 Tax=Streptomyces mashuensis TaxID=33904 RepID=UPI001E45A3FA|nr:PD-(D/E)XK nuclease family protein [Streptomyces mashuensis]
MFAALDLIEHQQRPLALVIRELHSTQGTFGRRSSPAHPGLLRWTAEALERYITARATEQETAQAAGIPPTLPVRPEWIARTARQLEPDQRGARQYEHTVWGRRYASADGRVRDLWVPSFGRPKAERPEAEKAAMAQVMAQGAPVADFRRGSAPPPDAAAAHPVPQRLRAFAFGCTDGSVLPILDWEQEEVGQQFRQHAAPAFQAAATGTERRPGESCVSCKAISRCPDLHRTPALWGGTPPARRRRRRSVSVWDLRLHSECPAQYHLTRHLRLDSLLVEDPHTIRGRAVDAWLNERHAAHPRASCYDMPGPPDRDSWGAGGFALHGAQAREAAAMLDEHRALCPLTRLDPQEQVRVQHTVTAYVPELDVVALATPDLLYTRGGGWTWRETKTSISRLRQHIPLLRQYPQLAMGVLLLNAGALGADPRRSWVEFELLGDGRSVLERIDPSIPEVAEEARTVITRLAQPLLEDTAYEPQPGRHCSGCRARRWCTVGTAHVAGHPSQGQGHMP